MAISEDLRSVQAVLSEIISDNTPLLSLLCDNLESLADQVEALEELPLAPGYPGFSMPGYQPAAVSGLSGGQLQ